MSNPADDWPAAPPRSGWLLRLFETFLVVGALGSAAAFWWLRHHETEAPRDRRHDRRTASNSETARTPTVSIASPNTTTNKGVDLTAVEPQSEPLRTASRDPFAPPAGTRTAPAKTNPQTGTGPASSTRLPELPDRDRTSWQDPFEARLWHVSGWSFGADGMRPTAAEGIATFPRRYRRLMLDVEIASRDAESGELELRWIAPATGAEARLRISAVGMSLAVPDADGTLSLEGRHADFATPLVPGQAGRLRFGATGNRILVHWNDRRMLSCDQPIAQLGRELEFSWAGSTGALHIAHLRIEGE